MIPLFTQEEFNKTKSREKLPLQCKYCGETFHKTRKSIVDALNPNNHRTAEFCSFHCQSKHNLFMRNLQPKKEVLCSYCGNTVFRRISQIPRSNNSFCNSSCAGFFTAKYRTHGTRRSKLECYIESRLRERYPDIDFHFNKKTAIGSELDIFIPHLSLAFEINGIFHHKPIYGDEKLNLIIKNDIKKKENCLKAGIKLVIIDILSRKPFKEEHSSAYLDIIISEIEKECFSISEIIKMATPDEFESSLVK